MDFGTGELLALLIVGALAGSGAASVLGLDKSGRRLTVLVRNVIVGVLGAFVGSALFRALDIDLPDILNESISLADVLVAFVGALMVIVVAGLIRD
jgi:uncharacterized membrane protein YeaQ/YmgE (transglycosylase-associated protein family)